MTSLSYSYWGLAWHHCHQLLGFSVASLSYSYRVFTVASLSYSYRVFTVASLSYSYWGF